jgi:uncharacterized membrane protein YhhN
LKFILVQAQKDSFFCQHCANQPLMNTCASTPTVRSIETTPKKSNNEVVLLSLITVSGFLYCTLGTLQVFPLLQLIMKPLPMYILIFYLWKSFQSFYHEHTIHVKKHSIPIFPYHVVYNRILMTMGLIASSLGDILLNLHDLHDQITPVKWIKQNVMDEIFFVAGVLCFLTAHIMYTISFSVEGRHKTHSTLVEATLKFFSHGFARCLLLLAPVALYMTFLYWAITNIGSLPPLLRLPVLCYNVVISVFAWRVFMRFNRPTLDITHNTLETAVNNSVRALQYKFNRYQVVRIVGAILFIAR